MISASGLGIEWRMARSERGDETLVGFCLHGADDAARHDEAEGVDGIGRVRAQDHVAGRRDGLGHVGETFLRAQRGDHLAVMVELHAEATLVIARLGAAQTGDAARTGIAMGAGVAHHVDQLVDDRLGAWEDRGYPCRDR